MTTQLAMGLCKDCQQISCIGTRILLHVIQAKYVDAHRVHLWFSAGSDGEADLADVLDGPVFEPLADVQYFRQFRLEGHTLAWPNGADFAPEYLQQLVQSAATKT